MSVSVAVKRSHRHVQLTTCPVAAIISLSLFFTSLASEVFALKMHNLRQFHSSKSMFELAILRGICPHLTFPIPQQQTTDVSVFFVYPHILFPSRDLPDNKVMLIKTSLVTHFPLNCSTYLMNVLIKASLTK